MTDLYGKKCFITGAASGIGRALATAAAREGAQLVLTDINQQGLAEAAAAIRTDGGQVLACQALDIADYAAVQAFAQAVLADHGSMDLVLNVAGIAIWGDITTLRHEHWRAVIDVNLMGPIHVLECLVPAMIEAGHGGHIVNVSSAAGLFALPWHAAYSASKFGLRGLSEVLRLDLARHRIKLSVVCPGGVDTGLVETVQIIGVDAGHPKVQALRARFRRHAASPDKAAAAILRGIKRNRFIIYTSADIRLGYWLKRKWAWPLNLALGTMTRQLQKVADKARNA